jgi:hypothetical protein
MSTVLLSGFGPWPGSNRPGAASWFRDGTVAFGRGSLLFASRVLGRRVGGGELGADEDQWRLGVVRLGNRREGELGDRARAEDEAVS